VRQDFLEILPLEKKPMNESLDLSFVTASFRHALNKLELCLIVRVVHTESI
jgi:hypothetical protein